MLVLVTFCDGLTGALIVFGVACVGCLTFCCGGLLCVCFVVCLLLCLLCIVIVLYVFINS